MNSSVTGELAGMTRTFSTDFRELLIIMPKLLLAGLSLHNFISSAIKRKLDFIVNPQDR